MDLPDLLKHVTIQRVITKMKCDILAGISRFPLDSVSGHIIFVPLPKLDAPFRCDLRFQSAVCSG